MKAKRLLQFGINLVLLCHILFIVLIVQVTKSTWRQVKEGSFDLTGIESTTYRTTFGNRTFEYVYDQGDDQNPEKHLYTTSVGHLECKDKTIFEIPNVVFDKTGETFDIPINRLPLVIPVNHSQKRNLIYLAVGISMLMVLYSFFIFYQFKRFIKSVEGKDPFTNGNIKILYSVGILVIIVPVLRYITESIELNWIKKLYEFPGYSISSDISFHFYLFGLGILILGITEVLRQGILIKKEHELTI